MSYILNIFLLIVLVILLESFVYFVIRKQRMKGEESLAYTMFGMAFIIGIWIYAEHLFINKWALFSSKFVFALCFLFPLALLSRLFSRPPEFWKKVSNFIRRKRL